MIIQDRVYGEIRIDEQVLIDIINSPALERLKDISQHGLPQGYYYKDTFSRYEHSIGVLILLKKLGANINEQIAGLIHDISHSTFSHAIDWVLGDPKKQDHQDNEFLTYFNTSTIPNILEKYNLNSNKISDIDSFPLLEQPAPYLCADRVDYTLRELMLLGYKEDVELIMDGLTTSNNRIVFTNSKAAKIFAEHYCFCNKEHWMGRNSMFRYHLLSEMLKEALSKKIILKEDFSQTDSYIIHKMYNSQDSSIIEQLNVLKENFEIQKTSKEDSNGVKLTGKFRYVDPEVLIENEDTSKSIVRLSSLSKKYKKLLEKEREESKKDVFVKIKN